MRPKPQKPARAPSGAAVLRAGKEVLMAEADAIHAVAKRLDAPFRKAVELITKCRGRLVVSGMGKAGFVAQKVSATFASTGTPSLFLHPADALHGDLGRITPKDLLLALSHSGETDEMLRLMGPVKRVGASVIVMTAETDAPLAKDADLVVPIGRQKEAGHGLAPTTSTTVMLALGDALAMAVLVARPFTKDDFARVHPAGSLGRSLMRVEDVMRKDGMVPIVSAHASLRNVIQVMTKTPGRPGAAMVVDRRGRLVGMFTDGDLRRLLETRDDVLTIRVRDVMGRDPKAIFRRSLVVEAATILREHHIDQIAVVDAKRRPVGLVDVQDLLAARVF